MHISFEPFQWLVFNPYGLIVQGLHKDQTLPVHEDLQEAYDDLWPSVHAKILATPDGFDGDCAPLMAWAYGDEQQEEKQARGKETETSPSAPGQLIIATGHRYYSQSHTLKRLIYDAHLEPDTADNKVQPDPFLSWGTTLATVVLLPNNTLLVEQRSPNVQTNPNRWSCLFTEIVEPEDITWDHMDHLLARAMREELCAFAGIVQPRFVGLVHVPHTYAWMLVAVLDARHVDQDLVQLLLDNFVPDKEASAWAQLPAHQPSHDAIGLQLAQELAEKMATHGLPS